MLTLPVNYSRSAMVIQSDEMVRVLGSKLGKAAEDCCGELMIRLQMVLFIMLACVY